MIDKYFLAVECVENLALSGGEPFISPALPEIITHINRYADRISKFEVITNGTLIPSPNIQQAFKKTATISVLIDNYGEDVSRNAKEVKKILDNIGVKAYERIYYGENAHCGGWVDLGLHSQKEEEAAITYKKCAYPQKMGFCFTLVGNKLFPCSPVRRGIEQGLINDDTGNIIDVEKSDIPDIELWFLSFDNRTMLDGCKYCNGLCDDVPRFTAGEQSEILKREKYIWN
jgi:hypothetical protein